MQPAGRVHAEIEGVVPVFNSTSAFTVNGISVNASQVARVPAGLVLGARVEVKGTLSTDGSTLAASEVEFD